MKSIIFDKLIWGESLDRFEQSKWDPESSSFWEEEWEDDYIPPKRRTWPMRIGALVLLVAFVAFAFAWLPRILPPHLDFLHQNQELSQDQLVISSRPAVVGIQVAKTDGIVGSASYGTGFNVDPQGLIITNRHVVEEAQSVQITFYENKEIISDAIEIVEGVDLAIIRLEDNDLPSLPLSDQLVATGDTVTIIGNPRGVSRVAIRGTVEGYYQGSDAAPVVFSIEAPIEPGSSGSPVLNEQGQVVGIVYALQTPNSTSNASKLALAIPITYLP